MVTPEDTSAQLEALASHSLALFRSDVTRSADTVDSVLSRLGVADAAAASFLRTDKTARKMLEGRTGKMLRARTGETGLLEELTVRYPAENPDQATTHFSRLRVTRFNDGFVSMVETAPLSAQVRLGSGTIRSSLFASTDEAGIPDPVAVQLAEMFATDIDFHRELRRGDTFSVVYEALTADGEPVTWNQASGRVLAAEFVNNGRAHAAVWFQDGNQKGGYFGFDGQSKRRAFLASPMEFSRVTSGFAMRMHPILQTRRAHLGVDYGAPTGTPVRTVGDGVVDFAGWQNGYGNVVQVQHSNDRTTLYAHLSRINVRRGQRVDQGTVIGAVGATGWATGPHLHFEIKVKGQHQDPLRVAKTSEAVTLSPASKARFTEVARDFRQQLQAAVAVGGQNLALAE
ncbi:MAG: peptidoglycan DD-metalloendopeptidase family protein [Rhizobacter sp.]